MSVITPAPQATENVAPINDLSITNQCQCFSCPECDWITTGDVYGEHCQECDEAPELVPSDACYGLCADDHDYVREVFAKWQENNRSPHGFIVVGSRMGWRNLDGYKIVGLDGDNIDPIKAISVNACWNQYWTINPAQGGRATCVQSHHDSPTGEEYHFWARIGCEMEDGEFSDWDR